MVVLFILDVFAATALTKFMDKRQEARLAVLDRLAMEIPGAANLAAAKCQLVRACAAGHCQDLDRLLSCGLRRSSVRLS